MPDTLAAKIRAKHPGAYDDMDDATLESAVTAKYPGAYDDIPRSTLPTKPVTAEQFMRPEDIANRDNGTSLPMDVLKGFGKRALSSVIGMGEMASTGVAESAARAAARTVGAPFNPVISDPVLERIKEATTQRNKAQELGGNLELAAELAPGAIRLAKAVPGLARSAVSMAKSAVEPVARAAMSDAPLLTQARQAVAKKLIGHVLDSAPSAANKGGKLVAAGSRPSVEGELASMLDELRAPDAGAVELPPPASLPPGYTPRSTVPPVAEPAAAPAPQGRLVPVKAPPVEAQIADALAEARHPTPPALVTTPPPAELPPGYTPRSTVPKVVRERMAARQAKMAGPAEPVAEPAAPPKRAYFLRSPEDIAAASAPAEAVQPTGSITIDDLPDAWKSRTGQDLFPTTGAEAKEITAALRAEIKDRGMTIGQAIAAVSKNRSISTATRYQITRSLAGGK